MKTRNGTVEYLDDDGHVKVIGSVEIFPVDHEHCESCGREAFVLAATTDPDNRITETTCLECLVSDEYLGLVTIRR